MPASNDTSTTIHTQDKVKRLDYESVLPRGLLWQLNAAVLDEGLGGGEEVAPRLEEKQRREGWTT
jgi:hypothetical protein